MAIKILSGDIIIRERTIGSYVDEITEEINSNLPLQNRSCSYRYPILSPIKYIFDDVYRGKPSLDDLQNGKIFADQIMNLFINHMAKYARARSVVYKEYYHVTRWGDHPHYDDYIISTYTTNALMSDTTIPITIPSFIHAPGHYQGETTQPPYACLSNNLDIPSIKNEPYNIRAGEFIKISSYYKFFEDVFNNWLKIVNDSTINIIKIVSETCHSSCHSSCHNERSRR